MLGISASPRRGSNSAALCRAILAGAASWGAACEHLPLRGRVISPCLGCEACRSAPLCSGVLDGMQELYPRLVGSGGLVLVSPVHNYNVSAAMKAFIDRLYCFYRFTDDHPRGFSSLLAGAGRRALVAAVCEQSAEEGAGLALQAMSLPLKALGYEVVGELLAPLHFSPGSVRKDQAVMEQAFALGRELARAL